MSAKYYDDVDKEWLINNINIILQTIDCSEHNYLKTNQLSFCNNDVLIRFISNLLKNEELYRTK